MFFSRNIGWELNFETQISQKSILYYKTNNINCKL